MKSINTRLMQDTQGKWYLVNEGTEAEFEQWVRWVNDSLGGVEKPNLFFDNAGVNPEKLLLIEFRKER